MEHPFYQEKRVFSRNEAWIHILLRANYENTKVMISGQMVDVDRGSFITSEAKLMERFQWGKEKLRKFLKLLEDEAMICRDAKKLYTVIHVINYEKYQSNSDQETDWEEPNGINGFGELSDQQSDREQTIDRPHADHRPATDKKEKNNKENKNKRTNTYVTDFESFWSVYPKKIRKKESYDIWLRCIKGGTDPKRILRCAENYATYCSVNVTEERYILHPSTFLNKERFMDYDAHPRSSGQREIIELEEIQPLEPPPMFDDDPDVRRMRQAEHDRMERIRANDIQNDVFPESSFKLSAKNKNRAREIMEARERERERNQGTFHGD